MGPAVTLGYNPQGKYYLLDHGSSLVHASEVHVKTCAKRIPMSDVGVRMHDSVPAERGEEPPTVAMGLPTTDSKEDAIENAERTEHTEQKDTAHDGEKAQQKRSESLLPLAARGFESTLAKSKECGACMQIERKGHANRAHTCGKAKPRPRSESPPATPPKSPLQTLRRYWRRRRLQEPKAKPKLFCQNVRYLEGRAREKFAATSRPRT